MRIIGGINKGKKIKIPIDNSTRPLRDLVKESIFNLITHSNKFDVSIINSNILDLFSGIGSFGLECHSRGAKFITFVENYKKTLNVLKKNITNLNAENFTKIEEIDCFHYFSKQILTSKLYDIIFLDPPYKESKINLLIDKILEIQLLKDNGILIIHRHKNDKVKITSNLNILISRDYGISKIIMGN
tara:strand:- start:253 stop:813 length:561 start_codon:yes stop_codon:yes gene_type:complete